MICSVDPAYLRGTAPIKQPGIEALSEENANRCLPRGSSDAALMPYHAERSKMFVRDRIQELDVERIAQSSRGFSVRAAPP
jgi:hypothetical protein